MTGDDLMISATHIMEIFGSHSICRLTEIQGYRYRCIAYYEYDPCIRIFESTYAIAEMQMDTHI